MSNTREMRTAILLAVTLLATVAPPAASTEEGPLTGTFRITTDACPSAGHDACTITLELNGESAKALYDNMRSATVADPCTEGMVKIDNNALRCFLTDGNTYSCDVGYNFSDKKLVFSDVTC